MNRVLIWLGGVAVSVSLPAVASTLEGTWTLFPPQGTAYTTTVEPPIKADGSSSWPAKRGVVPVQFGLASAPGPGVFESHRPPSGDVTFSFAQFEPAVALTLADVTTLSAVYDFTTGDCYGGSLRWSVRIDVNDTPSNSLDDEALFISTAPRRTSATAGRAAATDSVARAAST